MKTRIKGFDVECTMEEFLQYLRETSDTSQSQTIPTTIAQTTSHKFIVDGEERGKTSPVGVVIEMEGQPPIQAKSIREAGRISGIPHSSFNLAKALKSHHGQVIVNGMKFTQAEVSCNSPLTKEDEEMEVETSVKINKPKRNQVMKFKLIYPNGDNRLINLSAFCKDNKLDYNKASYRIEKHGEIKIGKYIIKRK